MKTRALELAGPFAAVWGGSPLSAELLLPEAPVALIVLAHGAGADFRHTNMLNIAEAFSAQGIASLRFNFPFMEQGRRRVDKPDICVAAIASAVDAAANEGLPLFLGEIGRAHV